MLAQAAHVPQMLCGDVAGLDGTRAAVDLPADLRDRCTVWVIGPTMASVYLDLAGVLALHGLLVEVAAVMQRLQPVRTAPASC